MQQVTSSDQQSVLARVAHVMRLSTLPQVLLGVRVAHFRRGPPSRRLQLLAMCVLALSVAGCDVQLSGGTGDSAPLATEAGSTATASLQPETQAQGYPGPAVSKAPETGPFSVAYIDRTGLWAYDGTDVPRLVLEREGLADPLVSPNGRWIAVELLGPEGAYGATVSEGLVVVPFAGGEPVLTVNRAQLAAAGSDEVGEELSGCIGHVVWRPDASGLAISTETCDASAYGPVATDDLWLVDLERGQPRRRFGAHQAATIAFSPDGLRLAVVRPAGTSGNRSLLIAIVGGATETTLLEYPAVKTESEWRAMEEPVWLPDGSGVVLATIAPDATGGVHWYADTPALVHLVSTQRERTATVAVPRGALHTKPALDGTYGLNLDPSITRLAVVRPAAEPRADYPPPQRWHELAVMAVDALGVHTDRVDVQAVEPDLHFLAWSPCAPTMLYRSGDGVYVKQHDVVRAWPLAARDGARTYRWAGCDHILSYHGKLMIQPIGAEPGLAELPGMKLSSGLGKDVRAFHVVATRWPPN